MSIDNASLASPSVDIDLSDFKNSARSSFIILRNVNRIDNDFNGSPSSPNSFTPYTVGQNTFSTIKGTLEDDGGLEGLRSTLSLQSEEIQFVFIRFRSKTVLVQYLPEQISAVNRARAMVTGRLLGSKIQRFTIRNDDSNEGERNASISSRLTTITISHPRQLTDPFLRTHTTRGSFSTSPTKFFPTSYSQSSFSSPASESISRFGNMLNQFNPPDVPQSVSSATLTSSPFPASTSMSTLDSTSSTRSPDENALLTAFSAVGLGIGGVGQNVISPFRETFETTTFDPKSSPNFDNFEQFKVDELMKTFPIGGSTTNESENGIEEPIRSSDFPRPPQRASTLISPVTLKPSTTLIQRRSSEVTASTTGAFIDSYHNRLEQESYNDEIEKSSTIGIGSSNGAGQISIQALHSRSINQTPCSSSFSTSLSDTSSLYGRVIGGRGLNNGMKGQQYGVLGTGLRKKNNDEMEMNSKVERGNGIDLKKVKENSSIGLRKSVSMKALSISASSAMTHESVFSTHWDTNQQTFIDSHEDDKNFEQLERERIEFLNWKRDQERMIVTKERERERIRRAMDEARREKVLKKLMLEQGMINTMEGVSKSIQTPLPSEVNSEEAKISVTRTNSPYSKSSAAKSTESFKSRSKRSLHNLPSPPHPPPPLPLPKSPSTGEPTMIENIPAAIENNIKTEDTQAKEDVQKDKSITSDKSDYGDTISSENQNRNENKATNSNLRLDVSNHKLEDLSYDLFSSPSSINSRIGNGGGGQNGTTAPPLDERVKAAIEREMRRPVITIEGHVRPRVRQQKRIRTRTTSDTFTTDKKDLPPNPESPKMFDGGKSENLEKSPLITSMMEAQQKAKAFPKSDSNLASLQILGEDEDLIDQLSDYFPKNGMTIKTLDPDGKRVGSGWALSEVKGLQVGKQVEKDLPILPLDEESSIEEALLTLTDDLYMKTWKDSVDTVGTAVTHDQDLSQKPLLENKNNSNEGLTLMDQIFRSKMIALQSKMEAVSSDIDEKVIGTSGMSNDEFDAIRERQDQLESLLIDLQRRRTVKKEEEGLVRARWARQQIERQNLDAYERSRLESEERMRRAKKLEETQEEERRQNLLEEEQEAVEKRIEEENVRRKIAERQREIKLEKLRLAEELQMRLRKEIQEKQDARQRRRKELLDSMKQKAEAKESILKGFLTIQFGSGQRFKRRDFDLFSDKICLYDVEQKSQPLQPNEVIQITTGSVISLSDAFEEVQVPHAFSITLNPDVQTGVLQSLQEPIIAYTDNEQSKETLLVAISMFSGLNNV